MLSKVLHAVAILFILYLLTVAVGGPSTMTSQEWFNY